MNIDDDSVISATFDPKLWTTALPVISEEEEDAISTIVVVIIGAIIAIIVLCSMGIFIDCLHQDETPPKRNPLRIKVLPFLNKRHYNNDKRSLTSNVCSVGVSDFEPNMASVIV